LRNERRFAIPEVSTSARRADWPLANSGQGPSTRMPARSSGVDLEVGLVATDTRGRIEVIPMLQIQPWLALGVFLSTATTDAVYVLFNAAVSSGRRVPAATWSSVWYLLSAFAVISYAKNWVYVGFAASGSWIGAYISMKLLRRPAAGGVEGPGLVR
jgi:hypothetical protein